MGGNAFPDVGAIHKNEVQHTLDSLYKKLQLTYPHHILGSTGKKEFHGDLDIGIAIPKKERHDFFLFLKSHFGDHEVKSYGALYSIKFPIACYQQYETDKKRTGKVQIDFIMGDDLEWLKFFYHSPVESKLKGTHRNIAISSLAGFTDRYEDEMRDVYDRPVLLRRWKWSPTTALTQVERRSRRSLVTGLYIKKQDELFLSDAITDPKKAAEVLFKGKLSHNYFDSCETVVEAINILYQDQPEYKERIFEQMAWDLRHNHNIGNVGWEYPPEIAVYME